MQISLSASELAEMHLWQPGLSTKGSYKCKLEAFLSVFEHITNKYFPRQDYLDNEYFFFPLLACVVLYSCTSAASFSSISMCLLAHMHIHTCTDIETYHGISS